ncbi:MAG: twin-arginine translocation signal domain-containing protein [Eggerthellaceae bacterium]
MSTEGKNIASAGVSRRSFLMGLGVTAAVVAGGLAGCAPQSRGACKRRKRSDAASASNADATGAQARHHLPPLRPRLRSRKPRAPTSSSWAAAWPA